MKAGPALAALLCLSALPVFLAAPSSAAEPAAEAVAEEMEIDGWWVNERGSAVELKREGRRLGGTYHSAVGAVDREDGYPLHGLINGDLVAFCVDWGDPRGGGRAAASVSCWVGQHTVDPASGKQRIHSQWHLTRDLPDDREADDLWGSVLTGASVFEHSAAPQGEAPGG